MYSRMVGQFFSGKLCSHGACIGERRYRVSSVAAGISSGNRATPDGRAAQDFCRLSLGSRSGLQSAGSDWQTHDCLFHRGPAGIRAPFVAPASAFLRRSLLGAAPTRALYVGLERGTRSAPGGGPHRYARSGGAAVVPEPGSVRDLVVAASATNRLEKLLGFFQLRELFFGVLKLARVHAAARAPVLHGKTQVQHLVEQDVFHGQS